MSVTQCPELILISGLQKLSDIPKLWLTFVDLDSIKGESFSSKKVIKHPLLNYMMSHTQYNLLI